MYLCVVLGCAEAIEDKTVAFIYIMPIKKFLLVSSFFFSFDLSQCVLFFHHPPYEYNLLVALLFISMWEN